VATTIFVLVILQSTRTARFQGSALVAIPLALVAFHSRSCRSTAAR
jgi:hypothetical protein